MDINNLNPHFAFQRIVEALAQLSPEEIQHLQNPLYSVEIRVVKLKRVKEEKTDDASNDVDVELLMQTLIQSSNRQEAYDVLEKQCPHKKDLEAIARKLDVPFSKKDKIADLRDRIVETTVGAKIRSQAIQGKME